MSEGARERMASLRSRTVRRAITPEMSERRVLSVSIWPMRRPRLAPMVEADGDFAASSGSAGEEEIGDVNAGDEKHEGDRAEKDEEFGALRADEVFLYGDEANVPGGGGGIGVGIFAGEFGDEGVDLLLRLRDGKAGLETADRSGKKARSAIGRRGEWRAGESGGHPDVGVGIESAAGVAEVGGHDADDGVEVGVEAHFAAEDLWVGAVVGVPESVGDYDSVEEAGGSVAGRVDAANLGLCAEESEVVGTGDETFGAHGAVTAADGAVGRRDGRSVLKGAGMVLEVPEFGRGHADVFVIGAAKVVEDADELLGLWEGQRAEEDGVDDGESGDVGADAECESEGGDEGEDGGFEEDAEGVAEVLEEGGKDGWHGGMDAAGGRELAEMGWEVGERRGERQDQKSRVEGFKFHSIPPPVHLSARLTTRKWKWGIRTSKTKATQALKA